MVFVKSHNALLDNGAYAESLMRIEHSSITADQPSGRYVIDGASQDIEIPRGMIVLRNYLSEDVCSRLRTAADRLQGERLQVMVRDPVTKEAKYIPDEGRVTEQVHIPEISGEVTSLFEKICREVIMPHYDIGIEWYEKPSLLRYVPGGKYEHHADSENWDMRRKIWSRFSDRAYSLLLYINDDFTGGGLYFQNFDYRIQPSAGMLVAFPSDHRYVHRAEPVDSGVRYAFVSWIVERGKRHFTLGKPLPPHAVPIT